MKVLHTRNVHSVFPQALKLLFTEGIARDSRNGPVLQYPTPVTTVYERPLERVIFWEARDANPFFHLYESLWMLAGRRDVEGVARYAGNMKLYSDDGVQFHGAYGHRWRDHFQVPDTDEPGDGGRMDQLKMIATRLRALPDDRRSVLGMWDPEVDLTTVDTGKDHPCNMIATFQLNGGKLDLALFCRSNDIVWGAYGANAVHFAFLLEYMAHWIGVPVGTFTQISVNWHGYLKTLEKVRPLIESWAYELERGIVTPELDNIGSLYNGGHVRALPLATPGLPIEQLDHYIQTLLFEADHGFTLGVDEHVGDDQPFFSMAYTVLRAHAIHKAQGPSAAIDYLQKADSQIDWVAAALQWLARRVK